MPLVFLINIYCCYHDPYYYYYYYCYYYYHISYYYHIVSLSLNEIKRILLVGMVTTYISKMAIVIAIAVELRINYCASIVDKEEVTND